MIGPNGPYNDFAIVILRSIRSQSIINYPMVLKFGIDHIEHSSFFFCLKNIHTEASKHIFKDPNGLSVYRDKTNWFTIHRAAISVACSGVWVTEPSFFPYTGRSLVDFFKTVTF